MYLSFFPHLKVNNQGQLHQTRTTYSPGDTEWPYLGGTPVTGGEQTNYLDNTALNFAPYGLSNEDTNHATPITYVIGQRTDSANVTTGYWWNGARHPLTNFYAAAINAAVVTTNSGASYQPAAQMVGSGLVNGHWVSALMEMNPTNSTFGDPQKLDDLIGTNSGWSGVSVSGSSINDYGMVAGTATKVSDGSVHSVVLIPCQFRLLNGSTNVADVDGMDFNGNRPTTISATSSYNPTNILSSDIGTTSTNGPGNYGMDVLGVDLPIGQGRANLSGPPPVTLVGQCLIDSLMMVAKVSPPVVTNITCGWNRVYQGGEVSIAQTTTNTWYVKAA